MNTIRIWFTKEGDASYISLLDLQRAMGRCLKRSGLPVWYTQGFNPHIYMTFTCPLSLGQESLVESVDVKTEEESPDFEEWKNRLDPVMPGGIRVTKVAPVVHKGEEVAFARYTIWTQQPGGEEAVRAYNQAQQLLVEKKTKRAVKTIDLKEILPQVEAHLEGDKCTFEAVLPAGKDLNVNPTLLLESWQEAYGFPARNWNILRTQLYTGDMEIFC